MMDARSLDQLGDKIAELSAHIDAATAHLLDLIREFDVQGGWNTGFRSCAAWLNWRVPPRPPDSTCTARCTCIKTKTAWWYSAGG